VVAVSSGRSRLTEVPRHGYMFQVGMKPHLRVALCFLSLASFSVPLVGADITPEEQTVRTTFAKLVFAIQVKTVELALSSSHFGHSLDRAMLQKAFQHNQLQFELSGFSSGEFL
jgi:hypothetical protein